MVAHSNHRALHGADGWATQAQADAKPAVFWSDRDDASALTPSLGTTVAATHFTATWGMAHDEGLAWVAGHTGLGVEACCFGAKVGLDLVLGQATERAELEMARTKPFPCPPEPMRWAAVELTRAAIRRADRSQGNRGLWPSLLGRVGVGFDS